MSIFFNMQFKYKAIRQSGEKFEGEAISSDKFALSRELKVDGVTLLSAEESKAGGGFRALYNSIVGRISLREKIVFARNLGTMLQAGLSLSRILSILEREAKNKQFKKVVRDVSARITKGEELSMALGAFPNVFNSLFISMVKAGEQSGTISVSLSMVARQMNDSYELQKKVRGAMMYPAIIMLLIIVVAILMLIFVIPALTATFKELNVALPLATRVVLGTSDFFSQHYIVLLLAIIAIVVFIFFGLRTVVGKRIRDYVLLHLPIIKKITIQTNSARTSRTFASLVSSGVDIVRALEITAEVVQNSYYREVIDKARTEVQKGNPISAIFAEHSELYPIFVSEMISVGEETGKLGEMLTGVADFYEKEVDQTTKNLSTVIEPVLMVIIGAAVGIFAVSVISPIYSLVNNI